MSIYKEFEYEMTFEDQHGLRSEIYAATIWENGDAEVVIRSRAGEVIRTRRSSWSAPHMAVDWAYGGLIMRYA